MRDDDVRKMVEATFLKRTRSGESPSQAIVSLLRQFATGGKFREFALSFELYGTAHKLSTTFVKSRAPGIVLNNYVLPRVHRNSQAFRRWEKKHRGWQDEVRSLMADGGRLESYLKKIVCEIEAMEAEVANKTKSRASGRK